MLGEKYFEVNGTGYTPSQFKYELQAVENVTESEAGTELIDVKRLDKHVFQVSWDGIDAELVDKIDEWCRSSTVDVTYRGTIYVCRARGMNANLLNKAWKYRRSDGLWNVSVTLTQI